MRRVVFRCGLYSSPAAHVQRYSDIALGTLVRALSEVNASYLRSHPQTPTLHRAGVATHAALDTSGTWSAIPQLLEAGEGSRIDMACWRIAELLVQEQSADLVRRAAEVAAHEALQGAIRGQWDGAITMVVRLFDRESARQHSERSLQAMLNALSYVNSAYLATHPRTTPLYGSGVRYQAERYPAEEWRAIPVLHAAGQGDCEDLACARVAELVVREREAARPTFRFRRLNGAGEPDISGRFSLYHILVERPGGVIEDPSALLGMGGSPWAVSS